MKALLPANEAQRLHALLSTGLLDTPPEQDFDDIVQLLAEICETPIAAVSFVASDRQWFKARVGLDADEAPREEAFCSHTILDPERPFIVTDAAVDPRFARNRFVTRAPGIRFYAGMPLTDRNGQALGSLCVADTTPRDLDTRQLAALIKLSRLVMRLVESRRFVSELAEQKAALDEHALVAITDPTGKIIYANDRFCAISQYSREELIGQDHRLINSGFHPKSFFAELWKTLRNGQVWRGEVKNRAKDGSFYWMETTIVPFFDAQGKPRQYVAIRADITLKKKNEEELRRQRSELRLLFDYLPAIVYFKNAENQILRANRFLANTIGKPVSEIEGHSWPGNLCQEETRFSAEDIEAIQGGVPRLGAVDSFRAADGSQRWFQTDRVPVCDTDGNVSSLVVMARDVTEQRRATAQIEESKRFLHSILNALTAHLAILDEHGVIVEVNEAWRRFAAANGGREGPGVGDNYLRVCNAASNGVNEARGVAEGIVAVMSGKLDEFHLEYPCHSPSEKRWFMLRATRFPGDGPVRVVVAHENISARKLGEERLRLLSSALEQCKDSIIVTDARLTGEGPTIQYVNPAFTAMTGFSLDEVVGKTLDIQKGPLTDPAAISRLVQTLARDESSSGEAISYRKDGSTFALEWQVSPVHNEEGTATHFVGIQRDVTLRNANAAELVRTREEALESTRLKSRFLANMSHELRTPLNAINGLSAALLEQDIPAATRDAVALISQCGESLLENVQTILTHASLEAGSTHLEIAPFVLSTVVLNAMRIVSTAAQNKGIQLDSFVDPHTPSELLGDAFRLQQVLVNLLSNAVKFTDHGRVFLRIRARHLDEGRWDLRFAIADTGIGIPSEHLGKLFLPFRQVDESITRRFEGTGLGLAIVKSLVEKMEGKIHVASRPGKGTLFRFNGVMSAPTGALTIGERGRNPKLAGKTLWIVESDHLRRRQLVTLAKAWDLQVIVTPTASTSGRTSAHYDCVLQSSLDRPSTADSNTLHTLQIDQGGPTAGASTSRPTLTVPWPFDCLALSDALVGLFRDNQTRPPVASDARTTRKLGERIPLKILAADDIRTNLAGIRFICRHLGYDIDLVCNGAEVLSRLTEHTYDLILLDVQMPVLDGLSAAKEIRTRFADAPTRPRLVAVTANVQPGDRERCLAAGMDDYLSKPVLPKQLALCIEQLFGGERMAPADDDPIADVSRLQHPWIDTTQLTSFTEGMESHEAKELVSQLFAVARADFESLRPQLKAACEKQDQATVATLLHSLKGCVLSLGWIRLGEHCRERLASARAGRFEGWETLPGELDQLIRISAEKMEAILAEMR